MRKLLGIASLAVLVAVPVAFAAAQPSTVIIVRHGEKASQTESDPVLSEAGIQRAKDLAIALADARVSSVITTNLQRTRLTAAEVLDAAKLIPIVIAAGGQTHSADVAAAIMKRAPGEIVLVVGHSNTVTPIIAALGGPRLPNLCDSQYSNMFILEMNGAAAPRLIRANYGKADPVDPACVTLMK